MPPQSAANTPVELWQKLLKGPLTDIKVACAEMGPSGADDLAFAINMETQILQRFGRNKMDEMAGVGGATGTGSMGTGMPGADQMMMGGGGPALPQGPAMGFNPVQNQGPPMGELRRALSR